MNKVERINNFVKDFPVIRTDKEEGGNIHLDNNGNVRVNYNMSTAFTWMIKAAATCRHYASDIIYDIEDIRNTIERFAENMVNGISNDEYIRYIGIRDMGVDSNDFIYSKLDEEGSWRFNPNDFCGHYNTLFRVAIHEDEEYGMKCIKIITEELGMKE